MRTQDKYENIRFGRDLTIARERNGMNRNQFAEEVGLSSNAVKKWETGDSFPQPDKWKIIKQLVGIDPQEYKVYPHKPEVSPVHETRPSKLVPLISWVQAGDFIDPQAQTTPGYAEEWIETTSTSSSSSFALTVKGDSMAPEFTEGDILVVDPDRYPVSGNYIIAKNGTTEVTFKQYVVDGSSVFLKPLNDRYPIKDMTGVEFRIVGVVVEKRKRYF